MTDNAPAGGQKPKLDTTVPHSARVWNYWLGGSSREGACDYVDADVRDPDKILAEAARTLDFSKPIGVMMLGILGQIPDSDHPETIVATLMDAVPSGSYLALSDGDNTSESMNEAARHSGWYHVRSQEQIAGFFAGLELVEPGVVSSARWRPEATPFPERDDVPHMCGVGRKP